MQIFTHAAQRLTHTRKLILAAAAAAVLAVGLVGAAHAWMTPVEEGPIGAVGYGYGRCIGNPTQLTITDPTTQAIKFTGGVKDWTKTDRYGKPLLAPKGSFYYLLGDDYWGVRPQAQQDDTLAYEFILTNPPKADQANKKSFYKLCYKNTTKGSGAPLTGIENAFLRMEVITVAQ